MLTIYRDNEGHMYFSDRAEAGQVLSKKLQKYKSDETTVLALSAGGVLVGEYIAKDLGAELTLLLTREIAIPGEPVAIGTMSQIGDFTYNSSLSKPLAKEFEDEFHNHIEAEKMNKLYELNKASGKHTVIDRHALTDKVVIIASDGLLSAAVIDAAYEYLKPIRLKRLVAAIPLATIKVVDRLHILTDEIHCLSVLDGQVFGIEHYYTENDLPDENQLLDRIDKLAQT